MKRNAYLSVLLLLLCSILAMAGTASWFTSRAESAGAALAAGTLRLDPESFGSFDLGNVGKFFPGQVSEEYVLEIKNDGSLPLAWFGYFVTGGEDAALMEQAFYIDYLRAEYLRPDGTAWADPELIVEEGIGQAEYAELADGDMMGVVSLAAWNGCDGQGAGPGVRMGALLPGHTCRLTLRVGLAEAITEDYVGKDMTIEFKAAATQVRVDALNALEGADGRIGDDDDGGDNDDYFDAAHVDWLEGRLALQE